jgi:2-succinyl-5-enolpyruvyl-6-hydroxy-3-cyclohexene-1-carboxylate synthase
LAHALAEAASDDAPMGAPSLSLHVRIDERSAAFVALGLAKAHAAVGDPRPVAVVTTSGTAVGNLMPAVMEAHHTGLPLLLLTADRPGELRGVGANQTTDQVGLFDTFVRWSADVAAPDDHELPGRAEQLAGRAARTSMGQPHHGDDCGTPGPVHLNLEFRAPLATDGGVWPHVGSADASPPDAPAVEAQAATEPLPPVERGVVIAGDGATDAARMVAEAQGWPLLAEPTSGARCGPNAIPGYRALLESASGRDLIDQIHQVVVIGRPTLSRPIQSLIDHAPALYVARHGARWREAPRHATTIHQDVPSSWLTHADEEQQSPSPWRWRDLASTPRRPEGWGGDAVAYATMHALGRDDVVLVGSSGPIRAVDRLAPVWKPGKAPTLLANRGLSGIDGTVSTAIGMALGLARPVTALMGDVTFLHDIGGLLVGPMERRPDLRIVVVNDGGGTIFSGMEHAADAQERVRRVFTTPHGADFAHLCAGYGVAHTTVSSHEDLAAALAAPVSGISVIEARVSSRS